MRHQICRSSLRPIVLRYGDIRYLDGMPWHRYDLELFLSQAKVTLPATVSMRIPYAEAMFLTQ